MTGTPPIPQLASGTSSITTNVVAGSLPENALQEVRDPGDHLGLGVVGHVLVGDLDVHVGHHASSANS